MYCIEECCCGCFPNIFKILQLSQGATTCLRAGIRNASAFVSSSLPVSTNQCVNTTRPTKHMAFTKVHSPKQGSPRLLFSRVNQNPLLPQPWACPAAGVPHGAAVESGAKLAVGALLGCGSGHCR
jgi:hypothetical protein